MNSEKIRVYLVEELSTGVEKQYSTTHENRLLNFPFRGYLWTSKKKLSKFSKGPIPLGEIVVINDSERFFHGPKYISSAKVLEVYEIEKDKGIFKYEESVFVKGIGDLEELRLYLLSRGKDPKRRVTITNNQNLIYNHTFIQAFTPEVLLRPEEEFSNELFEPLTAVEIKPIFATKSCDEIFIIEDTRIISFNEYRKATRDNQIARCETDNLRMNIKLSYTRAIEKESNPEKIKILEQQREIALNRMGYSETLEERLEREFFGGR